MGKLVSEQDIIDAATKSKLHLKCFDNCEFSFAHILIALVRKRLAERLRDMGTTAAPTIYREGWEDAARTVEED